MISVERMLQHAQGDETVFSCVNAVAAGLPPAAELVAMHEAFLALPAYARRRALTNPLAAARYVARKLRLARTDGPNAWGIVIARSDGRQSFALRVGGTWWARAEQGITKVHPTRVLAAWEIR